MSTKITKETEIYCDKQEELTRILSLIQQRLDNHNTDAVKVHWGHIGDLDHVTVELNKIEKWLR